MMCKINQKGAIGMESLKWTALILFFFCKGTQSRKTGRPGETLPPKVTRAPPTGGSQVSPIVGLFTDTFLWRTVPPMVRRLPDVWD